MSPPLSSSPSVAIVSGVRLTAVHLQIQMHEIVNSAAAATLLEALKTATRIVSCTWGTTHSRLTTASHNNSAPHSTLAQYRDLVQEQVRRNQKVLRQLREAVQNALNRRVSTRPEQQHQQQPVRDAVRMLHSPLFNRRVPPPPPAAPAPTASSQQPFRATPVALPPSIAVSSPVATPRLSHPRPTPPAVKAAAVPAPPPSSRPLAYPCRAGDEEGLHQYNYIRSNQHHHARRSATSSMIPPAAASQFSSFADLSSSSSAPHPQRGMQYTSHHTPQQQEEEREEGEAEQREGEGVRLLAPRFSSPNDDVPYLPDGCGSSLTANRRDEDEPCLISEDVWQSLSIAFRLAHHNHPRVSGGTEERLLGEPAVDEVGYDDGDEEIDENEEIEVGRCAFSTTTTAQSATPPFLILGPEALSGVAGGGRLPYSPRPVCFASPSPKENDDEEEGDRRRPRQGDGGMGSSRHSHRFRRSDKESGNLEVDAALAQEDEEGVVTPFVTPRFSLPSSAALLLLANGIGNDDEAQDKADGLSPPSPALDASPAHSHVGPSPPSLPLPSQHSAAAFHRLHRFSAPPPLPQTKGQKGGAQVAPLLSPSPPRSTSAAAAGSLPVILSPLPPPAHGDDCGLNHLLPPASSAAHAAQMSLYSAAVQSAHDRLVELLRAVVEEATCNIQTVASIANNQIHHGMQDFLAALRQENEELLCVEGK